MKHKLKMLTLCIASLLILNGCMLLSDIGESFSCVPYDGMYTRSYWNEPFEKDGEEYLNCYESQFPIGFWGNLNVKFWNAYGDYHKTSTYKRFQEWCKLPDEQKRKLYARKKKLDGKWVDVPLD